MAKVFISYSHADEAYRIQLESHLAGLRRSGFINTWTDRKIIPGENWNERVAAELNTADIIFLLVSADFIDSDFCYENEMTAALKRHNNEEAIVIPVILRACDWKGTPFSKIQVLPNDGKPVNSWQDKDEAYLNIIDGIKNLLNKQNAPAQQTPVYNTFNKPQAATFKETYKLYGDKNITKFLTSPFIPETFLGRQDDLINIHEQLFKGQNSLLLINGEGGIGKTSLAAQYFLQYQNEYQHLAWVFTENNLTDALLTLAVPLQISFAETDTALQRLQTLLAEMHNLQAPCLLIIDNANDPDELEKHYRLLRTCTNFQLLFTSRITEFEQAQTYKIDGLPENEALALFKKHYPKHQAAEDEIFKQIRKAVGGNTLVLELLAKNLFQQNRLKTNYSLEDLLKDLQQKGLFALRQTTGVTTGYQAKNTLRKEKPENIIAAIYDLGALTAAEKKLLSVFAVLPAENIEYNVLEELLKGMSRPDENLLSLAKKGWLDRNENLNAFKISPVVQEIAKNKNTQLLEDCENLIYNFTFLLEAQTSTGHLINTDYQQAAKYARYAEASISSFNQFSHNLAVLYERLGSYHSTTGNLLKALSCFKNYYRLTYEMHSASPENPAPLDMLSIACEKLGDIESVMGNLNKALEHFEMGAQLSRKLCTKYPENVDFKNGLAISYSKLGQTQAALGNLQRSLEYYEERLRLGKELYADYPQSVSFKKGLAIAYSRIGQTQANQGDLQKALEYFELYAKLNEELYNSSPENVDFKNGLAIAYEKMGETLTDLGDLQKAMEYYELDSRLSKELYDDYPQNVSFKNGLSIAYEKLGKIQATLGNLQKAQEYFELNVQLCKELYADYPQNLSYKNGLAIAYEKLGKIQADQGNLQHALEYFELNVQLSKELYADYPQIVAIKNCLALAYQWMGYVHEKNSDKEKARNSYLLSKEILLILTHDFPDYIEFKKNLDWVNKKLQEK